MLSLSLGKTTFGSPSTAGSYTNLEQMVLADLKLGHGLFLDYNFLPKLVPAETYLPTLRFPYFMRAEQTSLEQLMLVDGIGSRPLFTSAEVH